MTEIELVLHYHGLRRTAFRKELLGMFYNTDSSLTVEEIRNDIGTAKDKVTVYRALDVFEKNGLIHKVPDINNLTRYALCHTDCSSEKHIHDHAHFICNSCNGTFCIEEIKVPSVKNSKGFNIKASKLTLEGDCPTCVSL